MNHSEGDSERTAETWLGWYADQPDLTPLVVAFWRPGGRLLALNRPARQLLGWSDALGTHHPEELVVEGARAQLGKALAEAQVTGRWVGELELASPTMLTLSIELQMRWDIPGLGPIMCLRGYWRATGTPEPMAPLWLVQHYERLVRLSTALAMVANRTHFELVSPSWMTTLGYSEEEMLRRPLTDFLVADDVEPARRAGLAMRQQPGHVMSFDNRVQGRDGSVRWLTWRVVYDAEMQRFYGVADDVTEQRALGQRLREASAAAEQASRAKSQFLANTSHEIRTPLNAILNANELILGTHLDDEQRELVDIALVAGRGLQALLTHVLDLARIESGHLDLEERPFDPVRPLEEVVRAQRHRALDQGLDLDLIVAPGVPARVMADELRLRQIVGNLVDNALKFTSQGRVRVHLDCVGEQLRVQVRDTGSGIPLDKQQHIFEPFSQVDFSDTRRHGGAGLGLTICREFAVRMGGSITVDSRPGDGTTFEVRLPLVVPAPQVTSDPHLKAAQAQPMRPLRVLVAEDNAFNARVLSKWLTKQGHSVVVVGDGVEACEMGRHGVWDLVLMDLQMPRRDGLEATRILRKERGPALPIVALTASAQNDEAERCREAGMNDYLTKPVSFERLALLLRSIGE